MIKKTLILTILFCVTTFAQNKKIIYGFDKIPQVLTLNPGAETSYKYHIGIPLLSSISTHLNISKITLNDILSDDSIGVFEGSNVTKRLKEAINKLDNKDYAYFNSQIDIINAGYKINDNDYLSGGFYIEADIFSTLSKDFGILATEGNTAYLGRKFDISQFAVQAETVGVFHIGLSRKIFERLTIGLRLKLYSGAASINSTRNLGSLTTIAGDETVYTHILRDIDFSFQTSGLSDENSKDKTTASDVIKKTIFGGNYGLGFDLGYTFHFTEQLELTASLLDFGFIRYSKNIKSTKAFGDYEFSGMEVNFRNPTVTQPNGYEKLLKEKLKYDKDNKDIYTITRPLKGHLALGYSFGRSLTRSNCHDNTFKDFYDNTVGGHVFAVVQPKGINLAYTAFFQRKLSKHINLKATYTIDDFSKTNLGLGLSLNIWRLNMYSSIGNILKITAIDKSNTTSLQAGINYIIN